MKQLAVVSAMILGVSAPAAAQSQLGNFYLQLDGGGSFFADNDAAGGGDIEYDPGYVFGGRLGYAAAPDFRTELEFSYSKNEVDELANVNTNVVDVDLTALTVTFGIYADFFRQRGIAPYVGAGAGAAFWEASAEFGVFEADQDETDLTAFGEAGVAVDMTPHLSVVPHYRFLWIDDIGDDEQFAHWLRLGFRWTP